MSDTDDWLNDDLYDGESTQSLDAVQSTDVHPLSEDASATDPLEQDGQEEALEGPTGDSVDLAEDGLFYEHDESRAGASSRDLIIPGEYRFAPAMGSIAGRAVADVPIYKCDQCDATVHEQRDACPACQGELTRSREPYKVSANGSEYFLSWWEDDSITPKHPYILVNPVGYRSLEGEKHHFADALRFRKGEQFVVCDSGGYQLITQQEKSAIVDSYEEHNLKKLQIYPPALLEWQVRNADAGMILDVPPNVMKGAKIPSNKGTQYETWVNDIFDPRLEQTAKNCRLMSERLEELREQDVPGADDFWQMLVIHGRPGREVGGWDQWKHLHDWRTTLEEAMVSVDGYAIKPQPSHSLGQMAFHLGYVASEIETDYMHCLQCGGVSQQILLRWFARLTDTFVTSDASSHIMGTEWRKFRLPGTWNDDFVSMTDRDESHVDRIPCRCLVCERIRQEHDVSFATEDLGPADGQYINMHNVQQVLTSNEMAAGLLGKYTPEQILEDASSSSSSFTIHNDDNEFWTTLKIMFSETTLVRLHTAMQVVSDAALAGRDGLANWNYRWTSLDIDNEPVPPSRESDPTQW